MEKEYRFQRLTYRLDKEVRTNAALAQHASDLGNYVFVLVDERGDEQIGFVIRSDEQTLIFRRETREPFPLLWIKERNVHAWERATLRTIGSDPSFFRIFATTYRKEAKKEKVTESDELIGDLSDQEARMYLHTSCPACECPLLVTIPDSPVRCGECGRSWALSFKLKLTEGL